MKNILIICDKGDEWEITGTSLQLDSYQINPNLTKECKDHKLFKWIENKIKTARVSFSKDTIGNLIKEDLIIKEYTNLEIFRSHIFTKMRHYVSSKLDTLALFDMYEFIISNNILLNKGYVITNDNAKDQYDKIVSKDDFDTIDILERYIKLKENLESVLGWYSIYRSYEKKVRELESIEEIENKYKQFVQEFERK